MAYQVSIAIIAQTSNGRGDYMNEEHDDVIIWGTTDTTLIIWNWHPFSCEANKGQVTYWVRFICGLRPDQVWRWT